MSILAMNDPPLLRAQLILGKPHSVTNWRLLRGRVNTRQVQDALAVLKKDASFLSLRVINALQRGEVDHARELLHWGKMLSGRRPAQRILRGLNKDHSLEYTMWVLESKHGCLFSDAKTAAALREGVDLYR